jgi:hypothetical protein
METPILHGPTLQILAAAYDYGSKNLTAVDKHAASSAVESEREMSSV